MSTREKIIDAAMTIVRDQGVARLTLDEAAKVAGISKGGVLYHFKSKDALIQGMVARLSSQYRGLLEQHCAAVPPGPNRWARAAVAAAFDTDAPCDNSVGGALLAAASVNPELLRPWEDTYKEALRLIREDAEDPAAAMLACLAMDGLWLQDVVGLKLLDQAERDAVRQRALDLLSARQQ